MHGTTNVAFEGTGHRRPNGFVTHGVTNAPGFTQIIELRLALAYALQTHQIGGIFELTETAERRVEHSTTSCGQSVRIVFDTDALTLEVMALEHVQHVVCRILIPRVHPDANVVDDRRESRLHPVGRPSHECQLPIHTDEERLEQHEAVGVVAGEVIHALLPEQQHPIEARSSHVRSKHRKPVFELLN